MRGENKRRVIIVTGSSRGLGKAIALRFGKEGDSILVNYRSRADEAKDVAEEISRSGGEGFPFQADMRSTADVEQMVKAAVGRWGGVDVLINNAGMTRDQLILRMSEQQWDEVMATNLDGPFRCVRTISAVMMRQQHGHIINIASIVGIQGREGQANYAASKAGLIGFTKACARELSPHNIQVNAVLPGYLPTDMGKNAYSPVVDRFIKDNTLGRTSHPGEVSGFIYHLSGMKNVSGQVFNLDSRVL